MCYLHAQIAGICCGDFVLVDSGSGTGETGADAGSSKPVEDGTESGMRFSKAELNSRLWRELLELDERMHAQRKIRLLTPEARVLVHLKINGPVSVTGAMRISGSSYRGFYAVLERLKQAGLIAALKDDNDQRVRKLSIDPSAPALP